MKNSELYQLVNYIFLNSTKIDETFIKKYTNDKIKIRYFKKGESIEAIYDRTDFVHIIFEGEFFEIKTSSNGSKNILAIRKAPQILGIVALALEIPKFGLDIIAITNIKAIEIDMNYFREELLNDGVLGLFVIKDLSSLLVTASIKMDRRTFFDGKDNFLIFLYEDIQKNCTSTTHTIKKKKSIIAESIGISERALYRIINNMKDENTINVSKGKITLNEDQINKIIKDYNNLFHE